MKKNSLSLSGPAIVYLTLLGCALTLYVMLDGSNITESSLRRTYVLGRSHPGSGLHSEGAETVLRRAHAGNRRTPW